MPIPYYLMFVCGKRGIRTPGPFQVNGFKTAAIDHSAIFPKKRGKGSAN